MSDSIGDNPKTYLPPEALERDAIEQRQRAFVARWSLHLTVLGFWAFTLSFVYVAFVRFDRFGYDMELPLVYYFHAALAGLWVGAGGGPTWRRLVIFGLISFCLRAIMSLAANGTALNLVPLAIMLLGVAVIAAPLRALFCWAYRQPVIRRCSLGELLGTVAAVGLVVTIWASPVRIFFQSPLEANDMGRWPPLVLITSCFIAIYCCEAIPLFFRQAKSRRHARYFSTAAIVVVLLAWNLANTYLLTHRIGLQVVLIGPLALVAVAWRIYLLAAEIAFRQLGLEIVSAVESASTADHDENLARD